MNGCIRPVTRSMRETNNTRDDHLVSHELNLTLNKLLQKMQYIHKTMYLAIKLAKRGRDHHKKVTVTNGVIFWQD